MRVNFNIKFTGQSQQVRKIELEKFLSCALFIGLANPLYRSN